METGNCYMRNFELRHNKSANILPCRWGYDYNRTIVHNSIITEWNLVCGRERLVDVTQVTLMFGVLLGNIIFGIAADRYGRKKILINCITIQTVGALVSAWSPWFEGFLAARFILAIANGGTVITSFVMCMEVVGGEWRTTIPILYQIPFGLANTMMACLAYFLRDWRYLQLTLATISGLFIFYHWFIPESPRWLLATGRRKEAINVLEKAARFNGMDSNRIRNILESYSFQNQKENPKFKALISTRELRKRTILLCLNWLICGISFFGFSQYLGHISQNLYFTVAVGGLLALPGTFMCVIIVKRFGRKLTISCAQALTALCFFLILAVPKGEFKDDWPRIMFAGLGIIGISVS